MKKTILLIAILFLNSCSYFGDSGVSFSSESSVISVADNGTPLSLKETNTITWSPNGIDEASVVHHYEVSLGTSPGSANTVGWTNVALARSYQFTQILDPATTYYANVRYVNKVTLQASAAYVSPGFATPPNAADKIYSGGGHTCAINRQGKVKCWGSGGYGQLGYNSGSDRGDAFNEMANLAYVDLGSGRTAKSMALGRYHTCALLDNDQVKCWGDGTAGKLGYDTATSIGNLPGHMASLSYVDLGSGRTAKSISAGEYHTCALLDNYQVKCWGENGSGQLGYDSTTDLGDGAGEMAALAYVNLGVGRTAKSISVGYWHTCAILDNDQVKCWGENSSGQLGYDTNSLLGDQPGEMAALAYVNLGPSRTAKSISTGEYHTCAILDNDQVKCWGENSNGQLGYDSMNNLGDGGGEMAALAYVNLGAGRTAKSISLGKSFTCAILDTDEVKCWGYNSVGQLGYDHTNSLGDGGGEMTALNAVYIGTGRTAKKLSAGGYHTCVILDNDLPKCWGYNNNGQLGYDHDANIGASATSMYLLGYNNLGAGRTAKKVSLGGYHTCAILDNDQVKCWGRNNYGQLGYDSVTQLGDGAGEMAALAYVNLGVGRTAKDISLGYNHTCVILDNDEVKCWGRNNYGQLGYDSVTSLGDQVGEMAALAYVNLGAGRTAKKIITGTDHTCAILDTDELKCWGDGAGGALGKDSTTPLGDGLGEMAALTAIDLGVGRTAKNAAAGYGYTCAILDNDQVKCWGSNSYGRLGYDSTTNLGDGAGEMAALGYVNLGVGRTAKSIAIGMQHTCVILDTDQVKCWGYNGTNALGTEDWNHRGDSAGEMAALGAVNLGVGRTAKSISLSEMSTCVVLDNNQVKCWGDNSDGTLGYDDRNLDRGGVVGTMAALDYVYLGAGRTAKSIAVGNGFQTCSILDNDQLKCWGLNWYGQVGRDNQLTYGNSPSVNNQYPHLYSP